MLKQLDFTKHCVSDFRFGSKEMFLDEVMDLSQRVLKELLEEALALEFRGYVDAGRYERVEGRKDYRNEHRTRNLITTRGLIEDIRVPRSRSAGFLPRTFERYKRVHPCVDEGVLKMFLMGISTRKVADVLQSLFDYTLSASYVSKVAKKLDEEVRKVFDRPLDDDFIYPFLDGIVIKVKEVSCSVKRTVLVAYGIRADGSRELIDFRLGKHEGKGAWTSFLQNLQVRGLRGRNLKLIISDGCPGLWAATQEVFPFIPHQLCWAHKLRNVANKCPKKYLKDCIARARKIYLYPTVKIALTYKRVA